MWSVRSVVRLVTSSVAALVAAATLAAVGCAEASVTPEPVEDGRSVGGSGPTGAAGGSTQLPPGCHGYEVTLPDAGEPALAAQLCAAEVEPVVSNGAARISLALPQAGDPKAPVVGTLTLTAELRGRVRGAPVVELVAASNYTLLDAQLSPLEETADGYAFTVTWPAGAFFQGQDQTRVSFRTALDLGCDSGTRLVNAVTEVHLCDGSNRSPHIWASTGDMCLVCVLVQPAGASWFSAKTGIVARIDGFDSKLERSL